MDGQTDVRETDQNHATQQNSFIRNFLSTTVKVFICSMCFRFFIGQFMNSYSNNNSAYLSNNSKNYYQEIYNIGDQYSVWVYLVESNSNGKYVNEPNLIWHIPGLIYGDYYGGFYKNSTYFFNYSLNVSQNLINNGSISLITCFTKDVNFELDLNQKSLHKDDKACQIKEISRYQKFKHITKKHLITSSNKLDENSKEDQYYDELIKTYNNTIISYWHPSISINTVYSLPKLNVGLIPSPMDKFIFFDSNHKKIYPVIYYNNFWNYYSDYHPISRFNKTLLLNITFYPLSFMKWQFYIAQNEQHQWSFLQQNTPAELDSLKKMLLETNFYVLLMTITISILHSVFEFLAFKNDIQFWKNKDNYEGISLRSVIFGIFQHVVVLLYVLDNETNFMVTFGLTVGLFIEFWKLNKIFHIELKPFSSKVPILFPSFTYKSVAYSKSKTHEYDAIAFKYVSFVLFPLVVGYAVYSLIYHQHKGWYSFILSVLYGFLLMFGFIMMTPQLFINYKLKSVAHLPWRMLTYKALNTFIDDIFAFVITMPTLYRIGCLRDDIIFVIYLYQRWIYPTDMKRVNEFGISGVDENQTESLTHEKIE